MVIEETDASVPLVAVCTVPPLIVTGPVKLLGVSSANVLVPSFKRLPVPVIMPEPLKVKLLLLELTVMTPGKTVPLTDTVVGTPSVSSNNTWSLVLNTVCRLLLKLIQLAEIPVSQTPLLPLELHC